MDDCLMRVTLIGVILFVTPTTIPINGEFVLTVNFIDYKNPTGLCAECGNTEMKGDISADQLVPVCCGDHLLSKPDECNNIGEARCNTRFRWTIRPFNTSLETRPVTVPNATIPPYYFTDCNLPNATCPFSEIGIKFQQGPTGFLGVAANPLLVVPRTSMPWTGSVQFFIEAINSRLPNIIDSLLINLDTLQLGADFTKEITFTGYHNISHMTMSFRVTCQTGFCGRDCTANRMSNSLRIQSCNFTSGEIVCTDSRYDQLAHCNECLQNMDISTDCSTCLGPNFDPDTNCTACLPGYDIGTNCTTCLKSNRDPSTNCTQCLPNRDPSTNCTQCLPNRDPSTNCTKCLPNRDPSTNCTQCLPNRDPSTNCTQCLPNRDPSTNCSICLFGFDMSRDCSVCLPGKNISSNCTTCLSGYTGENCVPVTKTSPTVDVVLVGGAAGGVGGVLLLAIIVTVVTVCVLMCLKWRNSHTKYNVTEEVTSNLEGDAEPSVVHKFQNPLYGSRDEVHSESETVTSEDRNFTNSLYETLEENGHSELHHSSASPSGHLVRAAAAPQDEIEQSVYDEARLPLHTVFCPESTHPSKSGAAYEEIDDDLKMSRPASSGVYDKTHHTPSPEDVLSANAYSELEGPPGVYSVIEEPPASAYSVLEQPASAYSVLEQPAEDYSKLKRPPMASSNRRLKSSSYSRLNGHTAVEVTTYDTADNHHHPQTQPQTLPPHQAALYDKANYPNEPSQHNNYIETADFTGPPTDSSPPSSVKPHPYDYVDTPLDGEKDNSSVPPAADTIGAHEQSLWEDHPLRRAEL